MKLTVSSNCDFSITQFSNKKLISALHNPAFILKLLWIQLYLGFFYKSKLCIIIVFTAYEEGGVYEYIYIYIYG